MNLSRSLIWVLCLLSVCSIFSVAADSASISGTVRDAEGYPLSNVTVFLSGLAVRQQSSDSFGHFRFAPLAFGGYTLTSSLTGYQASGSQSIHLQSADFNTDIVLKRETPGPLQFQSSGIHGLIDPGGYSASTASASYGVLRGIAILKRTDESFSLSAKAWPCDIESQLQKSVAQHPDQLEASLRLGQYYVAHNQPSLATAPLLQALALDAANEDAIRALAIAWLQTGDFGKARNLLVLSLETHMTPDLYELLARADEGSGFFQNAVEDYRQASASSTSEESFFGIGYELLLSGAITQASTAFAEGIKHYPRSIPMQIGAGTVHFLEGDKTAALSNFLAATEIEPEDHRPYFFLAALSPVPDSQRDHVRSVFKRYLALNPYSAEANYFFAVALSRSEPSAEANRIDNFLQRAIQLDPNLTEAHLELAESEGRRGDFAGAVLEFETALRLDPNPETRYRLALVYKRLGRTDDSQREMQLFRQSRGSDGLSKAAAGIDLAQFIAAVNSPHLELGLLLPCTPVPR